MELFPKKISISELYEMGFFRKSIIISIHWSGVLKKNYYDPNDLLVIQRSTNSSIRLVYLIRSNDIDERFNYEVQLTESKNQYFGGSRTYFVCPLRVNGVSCKRRVSVLYRPENSFLFGCRICQNIIYPTQLVNRNHISYSQVKRILIENKIDNLEKLNSRKCYSGSKTRRINNLEKLYKESRMFPSHFYPNR